MSEDNVTPITRTTGPGQPLPTQPRFPKTVEEKVIVAKCIVQAVTAAEQSGNLSAENYDSFWALRMVTELLEQAQKQIDLEGVL